MQIGFNRHGGLGDGLVATALVEGILQKYPSAVVSGYLKGSVYKVFQGFEEIRLVEAEYSETPGVLKEESTRQRYPSDIWFDLKPSPRVIFCPEFEHLESEQQRYWRAELEGLQTGYPESIRELEKFGKRQIPLIAEVLDIPVCKPRWKYQRNNEEYVKKNPYHCSTPPVGSYVTLCNEAWGEAPSKTYPFFGEVLNNVELPIYQLGEFRGDTIPGAINLSGELSLHESCRFVSNAAFHIGIEGFFGHFCETIGISRIIFYGPTSEMFFGYDDAINIKNKDCGCLNCMWMTPDWMHNCRLGYEYEKRPCCQNLQQQLINAIEQLNINH